MSYILTGYERTLSVEITKLLNNEIQPGYPKYYDGKSDPDFFIAYPQYNNITNEELAQLTLIDFNNRLSDFKTWIESIEIGFIFDTTEARRESDLCVETTTSSSTTTTSSSTTTTTLEPTITTTTTTLSPTTSTTTSTTTMEPTTTTTTTCDPSKCDYGLLYNWYAVDTGKLAPVGWHVSSDDEWTTLVTYLGGEDAAGEELSSVCKWMNCPDNTNGSGFSALPSGDRNWMGEFYGDLTYSKLWSSTEYSSTNAWSRQIVCSSGVTRQNVYNKALGFSIRCVRDTSEGWIEGEQVEDIDGNQYDTIQIGTQIWTVQNLKVTHYNDGESIPNVTDSTTWTALTTGALCAYDNDWETYACVPEPTTTTTTTVAPTTTTTTTSSSTTTTSSSTTTTTLEPTTTTTTTCDPSKCDYGLLYNWYAVDTAKLAPTGWHVPTDTEWTTLTDYLINNGYGYGGSGNDIAKSMASQCNWSSYGTPGTPGNDPANNNSSGFLGLPGGYRLIGGSFFGIGYSGHWWSSTKASTYYAWLRNLYYGSTVVYRDYYNMDIQYQQTRQSTCKYM